MRERASAAPRRALSILLLGAAMALSLVGKSYALSSEPVTRKAAAPPNIVLFLHGLGGSSASWDAFVIYLKQAHPKAHIVSASIFNGRISPAPATRAPGELISGAVSSPADYCFYRINFGAFDSKSGLKSLPNNGKPARRATRSEHGDFETFDELGEEVDRAVKAILRVHPHAQIALVAHSRGGLAARAFLQNPAYAAEISSVVGFLTQGAPENGSYFGRIYDYLAETPPAADPATWNVANAIKTYAGVDTFSPSIGFLATSGTAISDLASTSGNLPLCIAYCNYCYTGLPYGELVVATRVMGVLQQDDLGNIFTQTGLGAEYHVSPAAQTALIGTLDPTTIGGDSIVQLDSQSLSSVSTIPAGLNLAVVTNRNGIFHIYEPDQVEDIADGLLSSLGWQVIETSAIADDQVELESAPLDEGQAYIEQLTTRPAAELFQRWFDAALEETKDETLEWALREAFIERLSNDKDADTLKYSNLFSAALRNEQYPVEVRVSLADALAETDTLSATEPLLEGISSTRHEGRLHLGILKAIAHIGLAHRREVLFAEELSPTLERALAAGERLNDRNSCTAIAAALLNIGAESGIEAAGGFAAKRRPGIMEIDLRLGDTGRVTNPHAFPALSKLFAEAVSGRGRAGNEGLLEFAGGNLVEMGTVESVSPVLQWLRQAPDNAAPLVKAWFASLRKEAREATRQVLRKDAFGSALVKGALEERVEANTPVAGVAPPMMQAAKE